MAWELQRHMIQYIRPSIAAWAERHDDPHYVLVGLYAELKQDADEQALGSAAGGRVLGDTYTSPRYYKQGTILSKSELIQYIAMVAEQKSTTTNGAGAFYIDDWTTVPFCSEEVFLAWNG